MKGVQVWEAVMERIHQASKDAYLGDPTVVENLKRSFSPEHLSAYAALAGASPIAGERTHAAVRACLEAARPG